MRIMFQRFSALEVVVNDGAHLSGSGAAFDIAELQTPGPEWREYFGDSDDVRNTLQRTFVSGFARLVPPWESFDEYLGKLHPTFLAFIPDSADLFFPLGTARLVRYDGLDGSPPENLVSGQLDRFSYQPPTRGGRTGLVLFMSGDELPADEPSIDDEVVENNVPSREVQSAKSLKAEAALTVAICVERIELVRQELTDLITGETTRFEQALLEGLLHEIDALGDTIDSVLPRDLPDEAPRELTREDRAEIRWRLQMLIHLTERLAQIPEVKELASRLGGLAGALWDYMAGSGFRPPTIR